MPNITLYVKETDLELIGKAKSRLGDSMSSLFVDCLRERLSRPDAAPIGTMEKITLLFWNANEDLSVKKSFSGRWLVGSVDEGLRANDDSQNWDAGAEWSVAESQKGTIVVYSRHCNDKFAPEMETYDSFNDFRDASGQSGPMYPENVVAEVASALNEPYEIELDI